LRAGGRRPYAIPIGGSTPIGALGYARCAQEIMQQQPDTELIVLANGSGGTQAGLAAGLGDHARVLGFDVGARPDLAAWVTELAAQTAELAGLPAPRGTAQLDFDHVGAFYAAHTDECRDAMRAAAQLEGLILDPVYTGKAMAGLMAIARAGRLPRAGSIVFVHTGGLPGLFTADHATWLTSG